jgi:hypothetical protein
MTAAIVFIDFILNDEAKMRTEYSFEKIGLLNCIF